MRGCGLGLVERDRENISAVTTLTEDRFGLTDPGDRLRIRKEDENSRNYYCADIHNNSPLTCISQQQFRGILAGFCFFCYVV